MLAFRALRAHLLANFIAIHSAVWIFIENKRTHTHCPLISKLTQLIYYQINVIENSKIKKKIGPSFKRQKLCLSLQSPAKNQFNRHFVKVTSDEKFCETFFCKKVDLYSSNTTQQHHKQQTKKSHRGKLQNFAVLTKNESMHF